MSEKTRNCIYKNDARYWMKLSFVLIAFSIILIGIIAVPAKADSSIHRDIIESLEYIHSKQIECAFEHSFSTIRFYNQNRLEYLVDFDSTITDIPGYTFHWFFGEAQNSFMVVVLPDDSTELGFMVAEMPEDPNYSDFLILNQNAKIYSVAMRDPNPIIPYHFTNLMFSEDDINLFSFTEIYSIDGITLGGLLMNPFGVFVFTDYVDGIGTTPEEILFINSLKVSSSRAKGTLRSLGSTELAYQATNTEKVYGTFEELQNDLYIASGYTPENMITNYNLHLYCGGEEFEAWFIVIAIPSINHSFLNAFIITEDQVVRELNPSFILDDRINDPEYLRSLIEIAEPIL